MPDQIDPHPAESQAKPPDQPTPATCSTPVAKSAWSSGLKALLGISAVAVGAALVISQSVPTMGATRSSRLALEARQQEVDRAVAAEAEAVPATTAVSEDGRAVRDMVSNADVEARP